MRLIAAILLSCLFAAGLQAQVSISATAEIDFPTGANLMHAYAPAGYSAYRNSNAFLGVQRQVTSDSLRNQSWRVTIDKTVMNVGLGSWYEVTVSGRLLNAPNVTLTYKDTLKMSASPARLTIPKSATMKLDNGNPLTDLIPQAASWYVIPRSQTHASGGEIEWVFTRIVPVRVDSTGKFIVRVANDSLNTY